MAVPVHFEGRSTPYSSPNGLYAHYVRVYSFVFTPFNERNKRCKLPRINKAQNFLSSVAPSKMQRKK